MRNTELWNNNFLYFLFLIMIFMFSTQVLRGRCGQNENGGLPKFVAIFYSIVLHWMAN